MQAQLTAVLTDGPWNTWQHRPGGAYLLRADRMSHAERVLLQAVARAILRGDQGELRTQLDRPHAVHRRGRRHASPRPSGSTGPRRRGWIAAADRGAVQSSCLAMTLANGLGGFADGGRAYAIVLDGDAETPMPWTNVIANPRSAR